ncbi:YifB family Mg chelatase-like AAA ATPase [soil metagenome]
MLAQLTSFAVQGIDAFPVQVEVDVVEVAQPAAATWNIVGLGDMAVREARERVKTALKNSGLGLFSRRVVVNLAPADVKKEGSRLDLPMALAALVATGRIANTRDRYAAAGELSLEGRLQPLAGALPLAIGARQEGFRGILLPEMNATEAAHVEGIEIIPVATLREAAEYLDGKRAITPAQPDLFTSENNRTALEDLIDVKGQEGAKRALEIAAAGGHNVIFIGPPGSGKTMLARRMPGILPPMSFAERIEASKIHSIAGLLNGKTGLLQDRPFRAPHHTASSPSLVGGGSNPRPGEVSLAHHGVLFLDELPEFSRNTLEVLRQPLEDGKVLISRSTASVEFPARFLFVAAMNPTPSGFDPEVAVRGMNTSAQIQKYLSKISGPLLDRIDLHVEVPAVKMEELRMRQSKENSATVRERVCAARDLQLARFKGRPNIYCNAHMGAKELNELCHLTPDAQKVLEMAMSNLGLSARAYDRLRKVARTIADLASAKEIGAEHISEAVQYRSLDRLGI